jgi:hypothetical protein
MAYKSDEFMQLYSEHVYTSERPHDILIFSDVNLFFM